MTLQPKNRRKRSNSNTSMDKKREVISQGLQTLRKAENVYGSSLTLQFDADGISLSGNDSTYCVTVWGPSGWGIITINYYKSEKVANSKFEKIKQQRRMKEVE